MRLSQPLSPLIVTPCLLLVLLAGIASAAIGGSTFALTLTDLFNAVLGDAQNLAAQLVLGDAQNLAAQLVLTIRLPRVLIAATVGAALALAGTLMQGITRNPLASPALFGLNAGAGCLLVLVQTGLLPVPLPLMLATALGAALAGGLVLMLGGGLQGRIHPVRVVLAGVAVTALLTAMTRSLLILDEQAQAVVDWLSGSLVDADWHHWQQLWPWVLPAGLATLWLAQPLNLLALGEEMAAGLGVSPRRLRLQASLLVVILAATSVAVTGPIAFVGLLVPHLGRALVGSDHRVLLPLVAVLGAALMVWADLLSRLLVFPAETPVGLVTALIGAPCFLWLAARQRGAS